MAPTAADYAARNVRAERARLRWTQQELADRLGWSQAKVSAVEMGQRVVTLDAAVELCRALGVPLVKLLEGTSADDLRVLGL
jgi:transcriptional regulator with XRE-family HTH domain